MRSDDGKRLLPGTLVDVGAEQESAFFPGQLLGNDDDNDQGDGEGFGDIKFVSGQWADAEDGGGFVLGQMSLGGDGEIVMGQTVSYVSIILLY